MPELPEGYTFTTQLVAALKYLATTERTFTASELALRVASNVIWKTFEHGQTGVFAKIGTTLPHPIHATLAGAPYLPSIPVRPLPRSDGRRCYAKLIQEAGDNLDDIPRQK